MNLIRIFIFKVFFLCIGFSAVAQNDSILLHINDEPIYLNEYERLFSKNADLIDVEEQKDFDKNLELFVDYHLKLKEAENQGLDTLTAFTRQFSNYRSQLASQYLFNTKVNHQLLREAYQRMKYEREADYILIRLEENATPQDTLKAFQKAVAFKKELTNGGNFEKLALRYSEDPAVKENSGKLGWIGVFKTVYEFENAVYKTKIGEVSDPFRSQFGYHVIRVNAERKSEGQIMVSHILIKPSEDSNEQETKEKIENIHQKIKAGANFSDIAKQYSEDEATADKGGRMRAFRSGDLRSKIFEKTAFNLTEENPLSAPFKTESGWHIVQLIKHSPIRSFEEESKELEDKIKRNNRSRIVRDSLVRELNLQYKVKTEGPGLDYFKENIGKDFVEKSEKDLPNQALFKLDDLKFTYSKFLENVKNYQNIQRKNITASFLDELYEELKGSFLINYAKENLDKINTDYANEIKDYRSGMLIYDLIDKNVFQKSDDSIALKNFYLRNKADFTAPKQYEVFTVSANQKKDALKARKHLKRGKSIEEIKNISTDILVHSGTFAEGDLQLPDNLKKSTGVSSVIKQNGVYLTAKTIKVIPAKQMEFEDVKGLTLNKYQQEIEREFLQELREKHHVTLNHKMIKELKNKI